MKIEFKGVTNRLDIIKNLIAIGEFEELESQVKKLRVFNEIHGINEIISTLGLKQFQDALAMIDKFIKDKSQIVSADETEVFAVKLEIMVLEQTLAELEEVKISIESRLQEFQVAYQKNLGSLTEELLRLRKERLDKERVNHPDKNEEFENARKDYNDYQRIKDSIKDYNRNELSPEDQERLKKAFRKACKLCHPDVIPEEEKQRGQDIFIDLRDAYVKNDLDRVMEILKHLEDGDPLSKKTKKSTKKLTMEERDRLKLKIFALEKEIDILKKGDIYKLVESISNWDGYFTDKKDELNREIESLKVFLYE